MIILDFGSSTELKAVDGFLDGPSDGPLDGPLDGCESVGPEDLRGLTDDCSDFGCESVGLTAGVNLKKAMTAVIPVIIALTVNRFLVFIIFSIALPTSSNLLSGIFTFAISSLIFLFAFFEKSGNLNGRLTAGRPKGPPTAEADVLNEFITIEFI